MHRILVRTIVMDVPAERAESTRTFWTAALAATARRGQRYPEYHVLEHAAAVTTVMIQDVGDAAARVHLDIETDDIAAEVARLIDAGATEAQRHEEWVVLRDPAGLLFCVVPGEGEDFVALSTEVQ